MYHKNQPGVIAQMPFYLSDTQCTALGKLYNALITNNKYTLKKALYGVFYALYLEDQPLSQAAQTFTSPVATYFALRCWDVQNGMFINVRGIPVALAKLQYSIRLRCSHKILLSMEKKGMGEEWLE